MHTQFKSQKTLLRELSEHTGQKFTVSRGKLLIGGNVITDEDITRRLRGIMTEYGLSYLKDDEYRPWHGLKRPAHMPTFEEAAAFYGLDTTGLIKDEG